MNETQVKYQVKVKPSIERCESICERSKKLKREHYDRSMKETDRDESNRLFDLYHLHLKFEQRSRDLAHHLQWPHKFGDVSILHDHENKSDIAWRIKRKEERRIKFETLHRISVWFSHTSLGTDYGQFTCEKCGYTFYHSPSSVKLGKLQRYVCICGECVNAILKRDGLKEIFD